MKIFLHPQYIDEISNQLVTDDFLDGRKEKVIKYLTRSEAESSTAAVKGTSSTLGDFLYGVRKKRTENDNFTRAVHEDWVSQFSQEISFSGSIDVDSDVWKTILGDVTGENTTIDEFLRDNVEERVDHARWACLVEGPESIGENETEAQAMGERSYATLYDHKHIVYWDRFTEAGPSKGQLKDIVFLLDPIKVDDKEYMRFRHLYIEEQGQNYWSVELLAEKADEDILKDISGLGSTLKKYEKGVDVQIIETPVQGSFPFIPVALFEKGWRESLIGEVAEKNKEHLNKKSVRDVILYNEAAKRVAFSGVNKDEFEAWTSSLILTFGSPDVKMFTLDSGDPSALTTEVERVKTNAILHGLKRNEALRQFETKQTQSADSKKVDLIAFEDALNVIADQLEEFLSQVFNYFYWFEFSSAPEEPIQVSIGRDFNIGVSEQELQEYAILFSQLHQFGDAGFEAQKELIIAKLFKQRFMPGNKEADAEVRQRIIEGIQAATKAEAGFSLARESVFGGGADTDFEDTNADESPDR